MTKKEEVLWNQINNIGLAIHYIDKLKADKAINTAELADVKIKLHLWEQRVMKEYKRIKTET
jgi:GrpB-like predicted nucleotidyltransferase (UPF0157 family)